MEAKLQKWGNSQGIRLPKSLLESLGAKVGSKLSLELSEDRSHLKISPQSSERPIRGRYNIKDLLAASSPDAFEEFDWGQPVGKEVW